MLGSGVRPAIGGAVSSLPASSAAGRASAVAGALAGASSCRASSWAAGGRSGGRGGESCGAGRPCRAVEGLGGVASAAASARAACSAAAVVLEHVGPRGGDVGPRGGELREPCAPLGRVDGRGPVRRDRRGGLVLGLVLGLSSGGEVSQGARDRGLVLGARGHFFGHVGEP